jgi:hypothetical protein
VVPCRLSFILARSAPVGVIFRRGPSDWFQLIRWRTDKDAFEPGQWFRGKIDPTRSDLSPAGDKLIYFAAQNKSRNIDGGYRGTWTAISRPPYFTALALWPLGDTWFGGGLFEDEKTVRLNHPEYRAECHPKHPPVGLRVVADPMYFWDRTVLSERLARDGWNLLTRVKTKIAGRHPQKWEKPDTKLRRSLFLLDLNDGLDRRRPFHYVVIYRKTEAEIATFEADWADWDQRGRLAYTSQGKLWRVDFPPRGRPAEVREVADFNALRPDPQPSPAWARLW